MEEKSKARDIMLKLMETFLETAPHNVPQPLPLVREKAQNRLNSDDLISWELILKEWQKVSEEGKKEISKLLVLNSYNITESINLPKELAIETKDTVNFVAAHPEYGKFQDETNPQEVIERVINSLDLED